MATPNAPVKRHRTARVEGRRGGRGDGSSRDASEEDNDASDVGSLLSVNASTTTVSTMPSPRMPPPPIPAIVALAQGQSGSRRRVKELAEESLSEGLESPTYDGDIESSSTVGTPTHPNQTGHYRQPSSPTSAMSPYSSQRVPTPKASRANLLDVEPALPQALPHTQLIGTPQSVPDVPVAPSVALDEAARMTPMSSPGGAGGNRSFVRPAELPVEEIRAFVRRAIEGKGDVDGVSRQWRTNEPPVGRPVRIYADGVYDLFHFGHALQLRQAKLSFPSVHLLVGVCSDKLCADHKSAPAMTHAERCESIRHCRWVDEVLPDAPWVVDQAWLDEYEIDYIAHDELVYPSKDHEDVYAFAKSQGKFLPTRRTPAISTSDLLERIVRGYRGGFFDSKLEKNGHPELLAADVDWDSDQSVARRERRILAAKSKRH